MSAHFASLKGERATNEDSHNLILGLNNQSNDTNKINYYGVYDGHGGEFVSDFLSKNLPNFFVSPKVTYPLNVDYVNSVYDKIQNVLFTKYVDKATECGSTCLVVCHYRNSKNQEFLNIMNTGDSRCVICRNNIGISLTLDHKPEWPDEHARITKLGGVIRKDGPVYRIGDLSVSRAFGDKSAEKYVTHRPDIYKYKLQKTDRFIVVACDGLWDVMSSQDVVNYVLKLCYDTNMKRINNECNIAKKLAEVAITDLECGDNVTCIVVFFD